MKNGAVMEMLKVTPVTIGVCHRALLGYQACKLPTEPGYCKMHHILLIAVKSLCKLHVSN